MRLCVQINFSQVILSCSFLFVQFNFNTTYGFEKGVYYQVSVSGKLITKPWGTLLWHYGTVGQATGQRVRGSSRSDVIKTSLSILQKKKRKIECHCFKLPIICYGDSIPTRVLMKKQLYSFCYITLFVEQIFKIKVNRETNF